MLYFKYYDDFLLYQVIKNYISNISKSSFNTQVKHLAISLIFALLDNNLHIRALSSHLKVCLFEL